MAKKLTRKVRGGVKFPPGISPLLDEIEPKFQKLPLIFGVNLINGVVFIMWDETGSQKTNMAAAIFISDFRFDPTVLMTTPLRSWTPTMWV